MRKSALDALAWVRRGDMFDYSSSHNRDSGRVRWAVAAGYAGAALTVGLLVSAVYALPCEGRGFCAELDRSAGYVFLISIPPVAVVVAALVADSRRRPGILHAVFVLVVVLVPLATLGLASLGDGR